MNAKSVMDEQEFNEWCEKLTERFNTMSSIQRITTIESLVDCFDISEFVFLYFKSESLLKRDFIRFLPSEITDYILLLLDPFTLSKCCCVSKTWNKQISNSLIWKRACASVGWKVIPKKEVENGRVWKETFRYASNLISTLKKGYLFEEENLRKFHQRPTAVCLDVHNSLLAAGSERGELCLWNTNTNQCINSIKTHSVADLLFDQHYVYTASYDATVACWQWDTNRLIREYRGHVGAVYSISSDSEQDLLLSGSSDATGRLWQLSTGRSIKVLQGHSEWVVKAILQRCHVKSIHHKPGDLVAMTMSHSCIKIWRVDSEDKALLTLRPLSGSLKPNLNFNGEKIWCSTTNETMEWSFTDFTVTRLFKHSFQGNYCLGLGTRLALMGNLSSHLLMIERICSIEDSLRELELSENKDPDDSRSVTAPKVVIPSTLATYQLPKFSWSKLSSNFAMGASAWLDGFTKFLPRDPIFIAALPDHSVYLLRFKTNKAAT